MRKREKKFLILDHSMFSRIIRTRILVSYRFFSVQFHSGRVEQAIQRLSSHYRTEFEQIEKNEQFDSTERVQHVRSVLKKLEKRDNLVKDLLETKHLGEGKSNGIDRLGIDILLFVLLTLRNKG